MPIKDPEKRRNYNRAYARRRRASLTGLTSQTLPANVYVNPQHVDTLLDLHEVMAQAIDMLRNDRESTAVSRARALAYCCGVDAKLIEIATMAELQQPEHSEDQETELEAEYYAAQGDILDDPVTHDQYCEWITYEVRYLHQPDPKSEAEFQAATSDLISKASKTASDLKKIYTDALRTRTAQDDTSVCSEELSSVNSRRRWSAAR